MKKSNALMLSYMIFLSLALIADIFFAWTGLDRISMAATIAGFFFAFADLANWSASVTLPKLEVVERMADEFPCLIRAHITYYEAKIAEKQEILRIVQPFAAQHDPFANVANASNEEIEHLKGSLNKAQIMLENLPEETKQQLSLARQKIKHRYFIDTLLAVIGFASFFIIITFDWFATLLSGYQSIATTLAFAIIMLSYYLRDILDDKSKKEVEAIMKECEQNHEEAQRLIALSNDSSELKKLQEAISKSTQTTIVKEVERNEQTENALPEQG